MSTLPEQEQGASAPPRRRQKRLIIWAGASALFVAAVIASGLGIYNGVQLAKEERLTTVTEYNEAYSDYTAAISAWEAEQQSADEVRNSTQASHVGEDDKSGKIFLETWDAELQNIESDVSEALTQKQLPLSATNEELQLATEALPAHTGTINMHTQLLSQAEAALKDSKRARKEIDQEAARLAKKANAKAISFEELFRAGDSTLGNYYTFKGKIIQATAGAQYRVSITAEQGYSRTFWKDPILVAVQGDTAQRLLEDDIISFTAVSLGVTSYESIFGASIEIPLLMAEGSDVTVTGRDD